jgi:1,4-dihydroxy-2-naphthoate octaprenyltransferase
MNQQNRKDILSLLENTEVAAIATAAGDRLRVRMMHYATDENFNIYIATMKGDPKTVQLTNCPSISLLIYQPGVDINEAREVEITGKAIFVRDPQERELALKMTAKKSPVVKYLTDSGNSGVLDCIKVAPDTIKFRIFKEIVQGIPPTVIELPQNRQVVNDWSLMKIKMRNWLMELRAPFLTASIVPVLLGTSIAWSTTGTFYPWIFLLTLLASLLIHLGTNVINDYSDSKSGNDEANREFVRPFSGGSRVIQLGLLSRLEVLSGSLLLFFASAIIGFYLAWTRGPLILVLGAIGLVSGAFYTGRPFNWAKRGLGELMIGLNFGILMTLGAYYVQTQSFAWLPVIAAIPVSLLIIAVVYINEFPDYNADRQVGKKTLVVRLGREKAVIFYYLFLAGAYLSLVAGIVTGALPLSALLGLIPLPLAIRAIQYARKYHSSSFDLVPANALTVTSHLATGLLLTLAFAWEVLSTEGIAHVAILGVIFAGFVIFMYRHIERQKDIFLGLKQAVG